ncbi:hypothetical protein BABINDRAFT_159165 [Babjeviella inositovora NRRL Y-12698]|uniref:GB1/RHD3-type G domain-containing protein n=1 Tax=Babjeviella inositovora NRRL Y-12698 TaxID=984486 RepID=A0A1E3QY78_9ASCO|nr:uncharacterized protein BABINDRAFT_159165 [Babjeviella inositovora NRRL Y-12698]ODQ82613.1 hypothetical protein BABINDRAFT_159165 [Babjeviella inositovora NRRL Y-12698]
MSTVQIIDQDKTFNQEVLQFIDQTTQATGGVREISLNFHVISVFGSQSSGKSTLLNQLFQTRFDVMDEHSRQQTTKGIWMGHARAVATTSNPAAATGLGYVPNSSHILVMDVEGSDGRERGEDQDFERKAALFALSTSEILIVNIWENQVGLYQGANMGLLKTVFEVNLSLFQSSSHKTLLLFVIRDHVGNTPLENLSNTLTTDLKAIWLQLNKPAGAEGVQLDDLFDLKFHALAHKVLQPEKFVEQVALLGDRLIENNEDYLFKREYSHDLPIDGWTMYAEKCWEQIESNKDLDLPTQQILVARFKCEEIANGAYAEFEKRYVEEFGEVDFLTGVETDSQDETAAGGLAAKMVTLRNAGLEDFDTLASRYHKDVYMEKRSDLAAKIDARLKQVHGSFLVALRQSSLHNFTATFKTRTNEPFLAILAKARAACHDTFVASAALVSLDGLFDSSSELRQLESALDDLAVAERAKEVDSLVNKSIKRITPALKENVTDLLSKPDENVWGGVLVVFQESLSSVTARFATDDGYDFGLGDATSSSELLFQIRRNAWLALNSIVHEFIREDNMVLLLRDIFEESFRYDDEGLPKLWKDAREIDVAYRVAKERAVAVLPVLAVAKLADGTAIVPDIEIEEDDELENFSRLLSSKRVETIKGKFKKQSDAIFFEAKRSIIQSVSQIPYYIYLIIAVLGWNEFMAVLRNPFFFIWLVTFTAVAFTIHYMGLTGPVLAVINTTVHKTIEVGKAKLKEVLVAGDEPREEIEMEELSDKGKKE